MGGFAQSRSRQDVAWKDEVLQRAFTRGRSPSARRRETRAPRASREQSPRERRLRYTKRKGEILARQTRKECSTNIYHVGLKGENSQTVFFDNEDRVQFLQTLSYSSEKYESGVAAWVLMSNHIHLLLHGKLENFTPMFKSIGASYTKWANTKYKRDGSLWGGRFYSQGVVTENE